MTQYLDDYERFDHLEHLLGLHVLDSEDSQCLAISPSTNRPCHERIQHNNDQRWERWVVLHNLEDNQWLKDRISGLAEMMFCDSHRPTESSKVIRGWAALIQMYSFYSPLYDLVRSITDGEHLVSVNPPEDEALTSKVFFPRIIKLVQVARRYRLGKMSFRQYAKFGRLIAPLADRADQILEFLVYDERNFSRNEDTTPAEPDEQLASSNGPDTSDADQPEENSSVVVPRLFAPICPICTESMVDVRRTPCGHEYCAACIESWMRYLLNTEFEDIPTCPTCRGNVSRTDLQAPVFPLEAKIGDLEGFIRAVEALSAEIRHLLTKSQQPL